MYKNCTQREHKHTELSYWRNRLFAETILYVMPLSFISLLPGVYAAFSNEMYLLLLADLFAITGMLVIAFTGMLSIETRKLLFISIIYSIGIALLFYLGSFGPGLLFLLAATVFTVLITETGKAVATVVLNAIICILIGVIIYYEGFNSPYLLNQSVQSWIAVSSNLVFFSVMAVLLIPILFNGLEKTIREQEKLKGKLEKNKEDLQRSMALLSEKNNELESFASVASHDMKEPLRMIRSFMQLLQKNYGPQLDEKANRYIHFAVDGSNRMTDLIDELLEYSRIGRVYTIREPVDMNQALRAAIQFYQTAIEEKHAKVTSDNLPEINAVPVSVRMLIQNLVGNALKYVPKEKEPEIHVSGRELDDCWEISVSDNGIGIEEEYFDQIFLLFKRLHSTEEYAGSGMGLAICKKIVEQHGGEIWIKSEVGKGSTFSFTIAKSTRFVQQER